jgi:P4 family phage/plasmid primase-like protien
MRVAGGERKTDRNGAEYWLYRLHEPSTGERWPEPRFSVGTDRARVDVLDRVYRALLGALVLSDDHRQAMADRGIKGDPWGAGYRTIPRRRGALVRELIDAGLEADLGSVPGFYIKEQDGRRWWSLAGASGMLIPVRDAEGKVQALTVRADEPRPGCGKYTYLSSKKHNGSGPGAPIHVPVAPRGQELVRITEGVLKADVVTELSGMLTLGVPGVANWRGSLRVLRQLKAKTVRVAYDADARSNARVAEQQLALMRALHKERFTVELETWDGRQGKGLDDLLAAGGAITTHRGDDAVAEAEAIARQAAGAAARPQADGEGPHLTDAGNAVRLVRGLGADMRFCHPWKKWLCWDGGRWREDDTGQAERHAKLTVQRMYEEAASATSDTTRKELGEHAVDSESARAIAAMLKLAQSERGIPVLPDDLNRDPWLLNVANGTLDLHTGELRQPRRDDLLSKRSSTPYQEEAECPLWDRFILDVFGDDEDLVTYVQRLLGYCLTGATTEQTFTVCWGVGSNGKTTLLEVVLAVLGPDYAMAAMPDFLLARNGDRHPTELADLYGKRLVVCCETGDGRRLNEPLVKWLTGGDKVRARRMREDAWEFTPAHKLFLVSNYRPEVRGTDHGLWRRMRLIPFEEVFEGDRKDLAMKEKLLAEAPGVLAWMVRGCLAWQRDGMQTPGAVVTATAEYRSEQDVIGNFLAECCKTDQKLFRCKASALYQRFRSWVQGTGAAQGSEIMSQTRFGRTLTERGFERAVNNGVWYLGVTLRQEESEIPE